MPENEEVRITLRLPEKVRDWLKRSSLQSGRSMNNEIVERLEQSFRVWPRVDIPHDLYERARRARSFQRTEIEKAISKAAGQIIEENLPTSGALHRDLGSLIHRVLQKAPDDKRAGLEERFKELLDEVYVATDDRRKEPEI